MWCLLKWLDPLREGKGLTYLQNYIYGHIEYYNTYDLIINPENV